MKDAIISWASGYDFCRLPEFNIFLNSIKSSGFKGDVVLFSHDLDDEIHDKLNSDSINLVEFHAEATSEKHAMFWYLDGRVSAAWGTHTHVATADERVYPQGLGAIADLGMTGPVDSVIGVDCESSIKRFTSGIYSRFKVSESERVALNGALFEIDEKTKECISVTRIREESVV